MRPLALLAAAAQRVNEKLALRITTAVGTMWAAYVFAVLALVSLPRVLQSGDPVIIVAWLAQTFLQLVLLPIIIVGQALQSREHRQTQEQVQELHEKHDRSHELLQEIREKLGLGPEEADS